MKLQDCHEIKRVDFLENYLISKQSLEQIYNNNRFCSHDGYQRIS